MRAGRARAWKLVAAAGAAVALVLAWPRDRRLGAVSPDGTTVADIRATPGWWVWFSGTVLREEPPWGSVELRLFDRRAGRRTTVFRRPACGGERLETPLGVI